MIRGVNRRIIEVSDCNSAYFERAIFFVRPGAADAGESTLKNEADIVLSGMIPPPGSKSKRKRPKISRRGLWLLLIMSMCMTAVFAVLNFVSL